MVKMQLQRNKTLFNSLKLIKDKRSDEQKPFFSILVRMKNEERMLPFFLKSLRSQVTNYSYEIIFLDSGSTDASTEIVNKLDSSYVLYSIDSVEFSFSKTCNFLVEQSRSPYCIFLSAHVELIGDDFLQRLGEKIEGGARCGYFRQVVNHNNGYSLYDVLTLNKGFPEGMVPHIFEEKKCCNLRYSNAGSFFDTRIALETPFPDVIASEDYLWAIGILKKGFQIHYLPMLHIAHSHNETFNDITKRVKINRLALYGDKFVLKKLIVNFVGLFVMLAMSGYGFRKSYDFALAHAKGYLK